MFQILFGDPNDRKIKQYESIVSKINKLEPEFKKFSDQDLQAKTSFFVDFLLINYCSDSSKADLPSLV